MWPTSDLPYKARFNIIGLLADRHSHCFCSVAEISEVRQRQASSGSARATPTPHRIRQVAALSRVLSWEANLDGSYRSGLLRGSVPRELTVLEIMTRWAWDSTRDLR